MQKGELTLALALRRAGLRRGLSAGSGDLRLSGTPESWEGGPPGRGTCQCRPAAWVGLPVLAKWQGGQGQGGEGSMGCFRPGAGCCGSSIGWGLIVALDKACS